MKKRKYENMKYQFVYENSIDCLYYGYGFSHLNKCGLSDEEAKKIWQQAFEDMEKAND
jgi:hypothetical protein